MIELRSKLIDAVVYHGEKQQLTVHLRGGQRREYVDVPEHVYNGLLFAKSAGVYYKTTIKPNYVRAS
jgi:hypothetical protein